MRILIFVLLAIVALVVSEKIVDDMVIIEGMFWQLFCEIDLAIKAKLIFTYFYS